MEDLIKRLDCVRFQPFDGVVVYRDENENEETLWDVITSAIDTIESLVSENNRLKTESKRELSNPQWIPVTEKVPPDDRPVLVTCGRYYRSFIARYDHTWKKWRVSHTLKITHWMPLPDAPKEGVVNGL